jgi:hypothetical protein
MDCLKGGSRSLATMENEWNGRGCECVEMSALTALI